MIALPLSQPMSFLVLILCIFCPCFAEGRNDQAAGWELVCKLGPTHHKYKYRVRRVEVVLSSTLLGDRAIPDTCQKLLLCSWRIKLWGTGTWGSVDTSNWRVPPGQNSSLVNVRIVAPYWWFPLRLCKHLLSFSSLRVVQAPNRSKVCSLLFVSEHYL